MRVAIIGAGMAGLACAGVLARQGHAVTLFDKGRGAGGRMSTRRMPTAEGEVRFDHGAQYLTARDPAFVGQVAAWEAAGQVARWAVAGNDAWVGLPGMNAPVQAMAADADVCWRSRIDALTFDGRWHLQGEGDDVPFDAVVVAVPAEQVATLVADHDPEVAGLAAATMSDPCWTVMAAFAAPVPIAADRLTEVGPLASAIRNSAKPGRTGPEAWVLQADADWSRQHLEDQADDVEHALLDALAAEAGGALPAILGTDSHRWRYAKSGALGRGALWNPALRLGVCGDWLLGPRV
ncbi:NAD(P)/FAD-dependent oxidoreductase, partial [Sphingomonas bacterium]|uniref:NAD(P)/FAD-dependent oxidoreductase n=1 Tax=Sphingomonas bacterium TaxID=1895847 RepID=UPI0015756F04